MPATQWKQLWKRHVYLYVTSPILPLFSEVKGNENTNSAKVLQVECLHNLAGYKA